MSDLEKEQKVPEKQYKLAPPDGGWGYLVAAAVIIFNLITAIPSTTFGLLYGKFLASIGDETSGTALTCGIYFTLQAFSGFATNFLLRKYSYRKVGLIGAILYCLGTFATIFVQNLVQMIICFSIMQGLGCGLMITSILSSFNSYFNKRLNLMMGIAQSMLLVGIMVIPPAMAFMVENLGFRETLSAFACLALVNVAAMSVLQPVKWHMKKVPIEEEDIDNNAVCQNKKSQSFNDSSTTQNQIQPLLGKVNEDTKLASGGRLSSSIGNLGEAVSVVSLNQEERKGVPILDYGLLKDLQFLNINFGISFSFTADVSFNALVPVLLGQAGVNLSDIAFMMTVFFGCDLVSRILYSIVNAFYKTRSRYVFLAGTVLSAVFRIIFILDNSYTWKLVTLGILGFFRSFIQTTLILVIADEYKDNFPSALSLSMIISGVVSLVFGALASLIKSLTQDDVMVVHLLTFAYLLCTICWTIELIYTRIKSKKYSSRSKA